MGDIGLSMLSAQTGNGQEMSSQSSRAVSGALTVQGSTKVGETSKTVNVSARLSIAPHNGSFDFDRIVKSGVVRKRTKTTKAWKRVFLVLRPTQLSVYRDEKESQLRQLVNLSDLTTVAYLSKNSRETDEEVERKNKRNVFGVFTPNKVYYFEAGEESNALEWVACIRREARIEQEEAELGLSPSREGFVGFERDIPRLPGDYYLSSSPESNLDISGHRAATTTKSGVRIPPAIDQVTLPNRASYSEDFSSDAVPASFSGFQDSEVSLALSDPREMTRPWSIYKQSSLGLSPETENERVVHHGFVYHLRSRRRGVGGGGGGPGGGNLLLPLRQWKKLWAVLRPNRLAFYKSSEEYSAVWIIPLKDVVDVVEIDHHPSSSRRNHKETKGQNDDEKNKEGKKKWRMQLIMTAKGIDRGRLERFAVGDEEDLGKWLGGVKSRLAKLR